MELILDFETSDNSTATVRCEFAQTGRGEFILRSGRMYGQDYDRAGLVAEFGLGQIEAAEAIAEGVEQDAYEAAIETAAALTAVQAETSRYRQAVR